MIGRIALCASGMILVSGCDGPVATPESGETGGDAGTSSGGSGGGQSAGAALGDPCDAAAPCGPGAYCASSDCSEAGVCAKKEDFCGGVVVEVCRCDGTVGDLCQSQMDGMSLDSTFACAVPEGGFACGVWLCKTGGDACLHESLPEGESTTCAELPADCQQPGAGCDCFPADWLSSPNGACQCDATGDHFTITCP